jgi:hypothetical protein
LEEERKKKNGCDQLAWGDVGLWALDKKKRKKIVIHSLHYNYNFVVPAAPQSNITKRKRKRKNSHNKISHMQRKKGLTNDTTEQKKKSNRRSLNMLVN